MGNYRGLAAKQLEVPGQAGTERRSGASHGVILEQVKSFKSSNLAGEPVWLDPTMEVYNAVVLNARTGC